MANAQTKPTWDELILNAQRAGFSTREDDEGLWWVVTPKRFRRPSVELGAFANARDAWKAAAFYATRDADDG